MQGTAGQRRRNRITPPLPPARLLPLSHSLSRFLSVCPSVSLSLTEVLTIKTLSFSPISEAFFQLFLKFPHARAPVRARNRTTFLIHRQHCGDQSAATTTTQIKPVHDTSGKKMFKDEKLEMISENGIKNTN